MGASPRRLFWLHGVAAAAGIAVALGALAVAARAVSFSAPSVAQTLAACRSWLTMLHPVSLLVLGLGALGIVALARTLGAAVRIHRATRSYLRRLHFPAAGDRSAVRVVDDPAPVAFCAGLARPAVYISTGALRQLGDDELRAVLAHEAHHAARRDPLRLLVARALEDGLFFLPALRRVGNRCVTAAELAADDAALRAGGPQPLASAMLRFGETGNPAVVGISTERIDHLLGASSPKLPVWPLLAAGLTAAGLGVVVLELARMTAGAHISLLLVLMRNCGPLMLAAPILMGAGLIRGRLSRLRRRAEPA